MARHWTPEERARQAELIRQQKPWAHSTGPKTADGKHASSRNAVTHGMETEAARLLRRALIKTAKALKGLKTL